EKLRDAEFIGGRDRWFRPIETRIGPDGALYIIDFYNQAVIHNDTRGPRHNNVNAAIRPDRDHYFGRIWRVDQKNAKKTAVANLVKASESKLVKALENPNRPIRMTAHRLLTENTSAVKKPEGALRDLALNTKAPAYGRIHAMWILDTYDKAAGPVAVLVTDPQSAIAKNALRIAARGATNGPALNDGKLIQPRDNN